MDTQYVRPSNSSFFDKLKSYLPRNQTAAVVIVEVIIVLVLAGGTFAVYNLSSKNKSHNVIVEEAAEGSAQTSEAADDESSSELTPNNFSDFSASTTPTLIPNVSLLVYSNSTYSYSIKYPVGWVITNRGALESNIPSYIIFNPANSPSGTRAVAVYISTRGYQEQINLGNATSIAVTVDDTAGVQQILADSNGLATTRIILPAGSFQYVLEGKPPYLTNFSQMLATFNSTLN